jgi:hypothetical protein
MSSVYFPTDLFDELIKHLGRAPEMVAFMRSPAPGKDGVFRVEDLYLVDIDSTTLAEDGHCDLDDEVRSAVIKWAWDNDSCLLEAHSHGLLFPPGLSRFDLVQLQDWVPHVRWRLNGRPYVALVTASLQVDGIAWSDNGPEAIEQILVAGHEPIITTGLSIQLLMDLHV